MTCQPDFPQRNLQMKEKSMLVLSFSSLSPGALSWKCEAVVMRAPSALCRVSLLPKSRSLCEDTCHIISLWQDNALCSKSTSLGPGEPANLQETKINSKNCHSFALKQLGFIFQRAALFTAVLFKIYEKDKKMTIWIGCLLLIWCDSTEFTIHILVSFFTLWYCGTLGALFPSVQLRGQGRLQSRRF